VEKKSADRQIKKEDIIAFEKKGKLFAEVVKSYLRSGYRKSNNKRALAKEKGKFKLLLERSKQYGTVNVDPFLYRIIEEPIIKKLLLKPIEPYLHNIRLNNFFQPIFDLKIKDLSDFTETGLSKEDISRYIAENLLSCDEKETGDAPLTLYIAFYRLPLIKTCEKILKYSPKRIKEIIRFDNVWVNAFQKVSFGEIERKSIVLYEDLSGMPIVFLRKYFEWWFDFIEVALLNEVISDKIKEMLTQKEEKAEPDTIDFLKYLAEFDYGKASMKERTFLSLFAIIFWLYHERWKLSYIRLFHKVISLGYSPQVIFQGHRRTHYSTLEPSGEIDWERTLKMTQVARFLTFFRTPEFEVVLDEGKITFQVFDPLKVDSSVMRNVEKVYNIFRRRLRPPRAKWGTKTGIKKEKEEMYRLIQDMFKKMRMETDFKVAEIFDEIRKKGVFLSDESFKRIVYRMKK
jgi:hypothetical protein